MTEYVKFSDLRQIEITEEEFQQLKTLEQVVDSAKQPYDDARKLLSTRTKEIMISHGIKDRVINRGPEGQVYSGWVLNDRHISPVIY